MDDKKGNQMSDDLFGKSNPGGLGPNALDLMKRLGIRNYPTLYPDIDGLVHTNPQDQISSNQRIEGNNSRSVTQGNCPQDPGKLPNKG